MSRRQRLFAHGWDLMANAFSRANRTNLGRRGRRSRRAFEWLEDRRMLKASLSLAGTQTLVGGVNVNASNDAASAEQNIAVDINPTNPLDVVGISQKGTAYMTLGVYHSNNGGLTWTTTTIDNSIDSLGAGAKRFDPTIAYDSTGKLFIAYGVDDGTTTTLVVARSDDNGATFMPAVVVDSKTDLLGVLRDFHLATGSDGMGGNAVYVAYVKTDFLSQEVFVTASNNGGTSFIAPSAPSDAALHTITNANVALASNGEVSVSWFDQTDLAVRFDRDADGLFVATNHFGADVTVVDNTTVRPGMVTNFDLFFNQLTPATPDHGLSSAPVLDIDHSGTAADGTLYVAFADLFDSGTSNIDLYVARSVNQGRHGRFRPS